MTKIIYKQGDVTENTEGVFMHGCNAQGVMGAGVALTVRRKFPLSHQRYVEEYERYGLKLGAIYMLPVPENGHYVLNAITQNRFGPDCRHLNYEALYVCLDRLNKEARVQDWRAVAMPQIGCGLAGGDWNIVSAMIEATSTNYQPVVYRFG